MNRPHLDVLGLRESRPEVRLFNPLPQPATTILIHPLPTSPFCTLAKQAMLWGREQCMQVCALEVPGCHRRLTLLAFG